MTGPTSATARARFLERLLVDVPGVADENETRGLIDLAERLCGERCILELSFGPDADLFGDPALDLLLRLYLDHHTGRVLEFAGHGDNSRAMRWLDRLASRGLVELEGAGPASRSLTARGLFLMDTYLKQLTSV